MKRKDLKKILGSLSPSFIGMLVVSFALWYITKLNYTYITTRPIDVKIESNEFKLDCQVQGTGYRLIGHRYLSKNGVTIYLKDIVITKSAGEDKYRIDPFSLQNAISRKNKNVRIISIGDIPDITINTPK